MKKKFHGFSWIRRHHPAWFCLTQACISQNQRKIVKRSTNWAIEALVEKNPKFQIFLHIQLVPIMYEWGKVKTAPGNKIALTIYSWTVCSSHGSGNTQNLHFTEGWTLNSLQLLNSQSRWTIVSFQASQLTCLNILFILCSKSWSEKKSSSGTQFGSYSTLPI